MALGIINVLLSTSYYLQCSSTPVQRCLVEAFIGITQICFSESIINNGGTRIQFIYYIHQFHGRSVSRQLRALLTFRRHHQIMAVPLIYQRVTQISFQMYQKWESEIKQQPVQLSSKFEICQYCRATLISRADVAKEGARLYSRLRTAGLLPLTCCCY